MPYRLSSSRLKQFLASYVEKESDLFGAEKGSDSFYWMMKEQFFTDARFFLVEAYDVWRQALEKRKQNNPDFDFVLAAAGDSAGKI